MWNCIFRGRQANLSPVFRFTGTRTWKTALGIETLFLHVPLLSSILTHCTSCLSQSSNLNDDFKVRFLEKPRASVGEWIYAIKAHRKCMVRSSQRLHYPTVHRLMDSYPKV